MVYVGLKYTAEAATSVAASIRCPRCGETDTRRVAAAGTGEASAPYFIGRDAAAGAASTRAHESAAKSAMLKARASACTKCGARLRSAVAQVALERSSWGLAAGAIGFAIGAAVAIADPSGRPLLVGALIGLPIFIVITALRTRSALRDIDAEVWSDREHAGFDAEEAARRALNAN